MFDLLKTHAIDTGFALLLFGCSGTFLMKWKAVLNELHLNIGSEKHKSKTY